MKKKNVFLMAFLMVGFFLTLGAQKVSAAYPCKDGGGICYKINGTCENASAQGKDLITVSPAADAACAAVFPAPAKCCKLTGTSSSDPAATVDGTDGPATSGGSTKFTNPLGFSNVEDFLGGIMVAIQRIIGVLALVFIMIGAVMILASAGNSGMVERGKEAITMALVGLALGVAAPSLLKELSSIIGWGTGAAGPGLTLTQIAMNVLNFLLGSMGIIALVMMVIGGIMYLTSAGDEDQIDKGKEIFKYSLLGVFMAMISMVLVTQIAKFFMAPTSAPANATPTSTVAGGKFSAPSTCADADFSCINGTMTQAACTASKPGSIVDDTHSKCCSESDGPTCLGNDPSVDPSGL